MTITLYKCGSERNVINKSLAVVVKSATAIEATEIINIETPDVLMDMDSSIIGCDYAYINNFNRYYYINSIEVVNGNQILRKTV